MYSKFTPLRQVSGVDVKYGLIDNSETIAQGEVIIPGVQGDTSVIKTGGGTTGALLGVTTGIAGKDGKVLEVNSKAVGSDNVTVAMIQASFIPAFIPMEYGATLDADSETTDNSGAYGSFSVDATGLLLTESSVVAFTTVIAKQFFSFGVIPGTTRDVTGYIIKKIGFTA
jgi:hypothetical protein